jgi:hypothetical protein
MFADLSSIQLMHHVEAAMRRSAERSQLKIATDHVHILHPGGLNTCGFYEGEATGQEDSDQNAMYRSSGQHMVTNSIICVKAVVMSGNYLQQMCGHVSMPSGTCVDVLKLLPGAPDDDADLRWVDLCERSVQQNIRRIRIDNAFVRKDAPFAPLTNFGSLSMQGWVLAFQFMLPEIRARIALIEDDPLPGASADKNLIWMPQCSQAAVCAAALTLNYKRDRVIAELASDSTEI